MLEADFKHESRHEPWESGLEADLDCFRKLSHILKCKHESRYEHGSQVWKLIWIVFGSCRILKCFTFYETH